MRKGLTIGIAALTLLALWGVPNSCALDPNKAIAEYVHNIWRTKEGLPQNSVSAVVQTRDGYLWLGTEEGLVRFDGLQFTIFNKGNTEAFRYSAISTLLEDHEGTLWIGTYGGGLVHYDRGQFSAYTTENGLSANIITHLTSDTRGTVWIGTSTGLNRFRSGTLTRVRIADHTDNSISALTIDPDGRLWVVVEGHVHVIKDDKVDDALLPSRLRSATTIRMLQFDRSGRLWFRDIDGLFWLKDGHLTQYGVGQGMPTLGARIVYQDKRGSIWIGTDSAGLCRLNTATFECYGTKDGLSDNYILAIYEDFEGSLWVGTTVGGLNRFKDGVVRPFAWNLGLKGQISSTLEGHDGSIWAATPLGLKRWKSERISTYTANQGQSSNRILSLLEDSEGTIWAGSMRGLNKLVNGHLIPYARKTISAQVTVIYQDHEGVIWIGTNGGGLARIQDSRLTVFRGREGLGSDVINFITEDHEHRLLIGTENGLRVFARGSFSTEAQGGSRPSLGPVAFIYEDGERVLWLTTPGGGLKRVQNGRVTSYTTKEGVFDDSIWSIAEDGYDNLWMSSDLGIFRIKKTELNDFANGKTSHVTSISYGYSDGMMNPECNGGRQPAIWKTKSGRLLVPTLDGIAMVDPASLSRQNPVPPPVVLQRVAINDSPYSQDKVHAPIGKGNLAFEFAALSYLAPEKIEYRYKLEGFDTDWIAGHHRRSANYTNIPPGSYRFLVSACNEDGLWNPTGAMISLYLEPHFYQTAWFIALATTALCIAGWGAYRTRVQRLQLHYAVVLAERVRMAREIHDTVIQGFVGVTIQLQALSRRLVPSSEPKQQLDEIVNDAAQCLEDARRSISSMRLPEGPCTPLSDALAKTARQATAGLPLSLRLELKDVPFSLPADIESNILRIGREAVINSARHSRAREIAIRLSFESHVFRLSVLDDGKGFDVREAFSNHLGHYGLIGMHERATQINAKLEVRSQPGQGTEVLLEVPL
jgi:signal transduction histidine kinase/ligand-binding sensor domain-containing protein